MYKLPHRASGQCVEIRRCVSGWSSRVDTCMRHRGCPGRLAPSVCASHTAEHSTHTMTHDCSEHGTQQKFKVHRPGTPHPGVLPSASPSASAQSSPAVPPNRLFINQLQPWVVGLVTSIVNTIFDQRLDETSPAALHHGRRPATPASTSLSREHLSLSLEPATGISEAIIERERETLSRERDAGRPRRPSTVMYSCWRSSPMRWSKMLHSIEVTRPTTHRRGWLMRRQETSARWRWAMPRAICRGEACRGGTRGSGGACRRETTLHSRQLQNYADRNSRCSHYTSHNDHVAA